MILGIRKGKAIAALCWAHTGMQIREDFLSMGFTSVVKFSTGSAVYLNDQEYVMSGQNAVGMGIHRRR